MNSQRRKFIKLLASFALGLGGATLVPLSSVSAAPNLVVYPIGWNVIGLDSNRVTSGPNQYVNGARVCNTGTTAATNVTASFIKNGGSNFITIQGASTLSIPSLPSGATALVPGNTGTTLPSNCYDFYFNISVTRSSSAYSTLANPSSRQQFHINVTSTESPLPIRTPTNRELFVEKLVSQARNEVLSISGPTTVFVGQTVTYTVTGKTAPGGYEQLSFTPVLPVFFQLISTSLTYSTPSGSTNNNVYADACGWENDYTNTTYYHNNSACDNPAIPEGYAGSKVGDTFTAVYKIKVLGTGSGSLTNLVYDFSGSSYHYNSDFGTGLNSLSVTANPPSADIVTTKTGPTTAIAGSTVTYSLTTINNGPSDATNVIITDNIGTGRTGVVVSNNGTYNSTTGIVTFPTIATLANGATQTNTVSFTAPSSGSITDTVSSTSATPDPTATNNNGTAANANVTTTITPSADIVTTKTGPTTAIAGSTVTYSLTTINNGPSDATNVIITDNIGTGRTGVVVSNNGTYNSTTGIVTFPTIATLANGATQTNTVSFTAPSSGSITDTVSSTSATPDPTATNNNGTAANANVTTTITPSADIVTTKTGPTTAIAGSTVTYSLTTINNGPSAATNVIITDNIGTGRTGVVVSNNGTYNSTTGIVTFPTIATLANGATQTNTVSFTAPSSGSITDTVSSTSATPDPTATNNNGTAANANVTTTITPSADIVTTKTGPTTAIAGSTVTYSLTTINNGPSDATNVIITDNIGTGRTGVVVSNNGTYNSTTGIVTFPTIATLANGATQTNTVSFTAPSSGSITDTVSSTSATPDPTATNNNGTAANANVTTTITQLPTDLSIVKTDSPDPVIAGSNLTYAIAVTNNGSVAAANVVMSDPLPSGTTFQSITAPSGWTCTTPAVGSNGTVSCTNTSLAVGTSNFTLVVRVAPNTANNASLSNTATVSSTTSDSNTNNNSSLQTTTVRQSADLRLTKVSTPASPAVGGTFDYTITVTNDGPSTATNVQVRDALPLGIGYVLNTPSQGTYDPIVTQVWNVGTLNPGASATLVIRAIRNSAGSTVNTAEIIAADQSDPDSPHNNQVVGEDDQDSVTVPNQSVDLEVRKTVNNSTPSVGQNVTFTITVANPAASTVTATNIGINDVLPQGLTYQSHNESTGTYNRTTGVWSVPSLTPGTTATLTLVAQVITSGVKINTAQLSTLDQSDPNANNDSSSATVTATTLPPNLVLVKRITQVAGTPSSGFNDLTTGSKAADDNNTNWPTPLATYLRGLLNGGSVAPGAEVEYTIYFLNTQNPATNVIICDPIPANLTFVTNGYNSASPRPTELGALPTDTGIALASNAATLPINPTFYLTNANDSDRGRYYPPNDPSTPNACKRVDAAGLVTATGAAANTNGAIVVNVVSGANQLPPATASGNPTNSYGYIRFKARVR